MKTATIFDFLSTVFDFLSAQNLLVPFLQENKVLQDLEKEDLLILVEKLLNPPTQKPVLQNADDHLTNNPTINYEEELNAVVEQTKALHETDN